MINILPDELLYMILNYLKLKEIINFKKVCVRWNLLISEMKFKELIIKEKPSDMTNNWYHTYKSIDQKNSIISNSDLNELFNNSSFIKNFINLKYLKTIPKMNFDLNKLNLFTRLTILDMGGYICLSKDISLKLNDLKIAKIFICDKYTVSRLIYMDTKKLETFYCLGLDLTKFKYPESLKFLEIEYSENEDLKIFTNLEILICDNLFNSSILKRSSTNLKELHFNTKYEDNQFKAISFFNEIIDGIFEDKKQLKMNNLKLYYQGIELESNHSLNNYNFKQNSLKIIYDHYDKLADKMPTFKIINYTKLIDIFNNQLPKSFTSKFLNIQELNVQNVDDQNNFINFLEGCSNLSKLEIQNSKLNQDFYDNLPNICRLIFEFKIENDEIDLDYLFVTKFEILSLLIINESNKINKKLEKIANEIKKTGKLKSKIYDLNDIVNLPTIFQIAIDVLSKLKYIKHFKFSSYIQFTIFKRTCPFSDLFTLKYNGKQWVDKKTTELINVFENLVDNKISNNKRKRIEY